MSNVYKKYFGCAILSREIFYRGDTMKVTTEFRNGILFVRLSGDLTKDTVSILNDKVTNLVNRAGIRHVVFNVEALNSIDYKGISTLLYNYEIVKRNDGNVFLCGGNEKVDNILKYNHVFKYISEISSELCALNLMKG